jgi:putative PIN family toxin of toxin-antitoxin system
VRAVVDPSVLISATLAPTGAPARVVRAWLDGAFDLIVSSALLAELERALAYPKIRKRVTAGEAAELLDLLRYAADVVADPPGAPAMRSPDPDDDYLIAIAAAARAVLVSGDGHLLGLADALPVHSPARFVEMLDDDQA